MIKAASLLIWSKLIAMAMLSFLCNGCLFSKYVLDDMGTTYEELSDPQELMAMKDGTLVALVDASYLVRPRVFADAKVISTKRRILIGHTETLHAGLREAIARSRLWQEKPILRQSVYIHPQALKGFHEAPWEIRPSSFTDPSITEAEITQWRNQAVKIYATNDTIEVEMGRETWRVRLRSGSSKGGGLQRTTREPWVKSAQRKWLIPASLLDTALMPITVPLIIVTLPFSKW